jgi:hypothetical protein
MLTLMVSVFCLTAPLAVMYGFHARRNAPERALAWAGLVLSLITFLPFVMVMIASVLSLGEALCH